MVSIQLRGWQKEAFAQYLEKISLKQRELLWEATPGSGKTTAALQVIRHQLATKRASRVLVVVPTSHLKGQWSRAAAQFKIQLDSNRVSGLASDYHGAVVTYQQLGRGGKWLKELAAKSVVVLDEIHHAGEGLKWGDALIHTLHDAPFVLCLSGTAFRSDGNSIPFVRYDQDGMSISDYAYTYPKAVEDGVCRPTAFFTYGGEVSWSENDRVSTASFADALDPLNSGRRLRAALSTESGWVQPMLKDAHEMLLESRREDAEAGGLIVCADQEHARNIATTIYAMTGEKPVVVLSDDSTASKKIQKFDQSTTPWLVACNMVSEGVDIPRLRVGVYATTIRTKMYFRQFLGRVVRMQSKRLASQVAYVYLPADPVLRMFAEEIEQETKQAIRTVEKLDREDQINREKKEQSWVAVSAFNSGVESVIVHGNQLSFFGQSMPVVREAIRKEVSDKREVAVTRSERKEMLCVEIKTLVGLVHKRKGLQHSAIHMNLNREQSVKSQIQCTEMQLEHRKVLLERMLGR